MTNNSKARGDGKVEVIPASLIGMAMSPTIKEMKTALKCMSTTPRQQASGTTTSAPTACLMSAAGTEHLFTARTDAL